MARGNTDRVGLEATMKRLEKLREYRSRLSNDVAERVAKHIAAGYPVSEARELAVYVSKCNLRIRLINAVLDEAIATDQRVLQPARA